MLVDYLATFLGYLIGFGVVGSLIVLVALVMYLIIKDAKEYE